MRQWMMILILLGGMTGCAGTQQRDLHFKYVSMTPDSRGPLASVRPLKIKIENFEDARAYTENMGHRLNSGGSETGSILTKKPLPAILQASLAAMLQKNGHRIKGSKPDIVLSGALTEFGIDIRTIPMAAEYAGPLSFTMAVEDRRHRLLYKHDYQAYYHVKRATMASISEDQELSKAIDQLMYQVISDRQLYDVLSNLLPEAPRVPFYKRIKRIKLF